MIYFSLVNIIVVLHLVILSVAGLQPLREAMEEEYNGRDGNSASLRNKRANNQRIVVKLLYTTPRPAPPPPATLVVLRDDYRGRSQLHDDNVQQQRRLDSDQRQLNSDQSQLGSDQRRLADDQRQLSNDQRRVDRNGRRRYDGIIDDRRRLIYDRNRRSYALTAEDAQSGQIVA